MGEEVGASVGKEVGEADGNVLGDADGNPLGTSVGEADGNVLGDADGNPLGTSVGASVGALVGTLVGASVGAEVGVLVGRGPSKIRTVASLLSARAKKRTVTVLPMPSKSSISWALPGVREATFRDLPVEFFAAQTTVTRLGSARVSAFTPDCRLKPTK